MTKPHISLRSSFVASVGGSLRKSPKEIHPLSVWYLEWESNPQNTVFETATSANSVIKAYTKINSQTTAEQVDHSHSHTKTTHLVNVFKKKY